MPLPPYYLEVIMTGGVACMVTVLMNGRGVLQVFFVAFPKGPEVLNDNGCDIMVGDVYAQQCNEAYTTIQLPASASRKGTASLHVKVDTRAGGNMLPLHVFRHLYPDQISPAGLPTGLGHISTRLTAYNGSHIPLYGALHGPITWQPDHPDT